MLRMKNGHLDVDKRRLDVGPRLIYVPTALRLRYSDVQCPRCRRAGQVDLYELERAVTEATRRGRKSVTGRWVNNTEMVVVGDLVKRGRCS